MADTRTPEQRRRIMQSVKTADTGPELYVRRLLHGLGYRYRLHGRDLPGRPDIVMAGRGKVIFVHGCFWHNHQCAKGRAPNSKLEYWQPKLDRNRERDLAVCGLLETMGWEVLVVWQCEIGDPVALTSKLTDFCEERSPALSRDRIYRTARSG